ncbi:MAG: helix-turn-helix domain-containing protein [Coriobacteriia bacterium]
MHGTAVYSLHGRRTESMRGVRTRLRELRLERDRSQEKLGELAGLNPPYISSAERTRKRLGEGDPQTNDGTGERPLGAA